MAKHFATLIFFALLFSTLGGVWSGNTFFDVDEQHEIQAPKWRNTPTSKAKTHQYLVEKLLTAIEKENVQKLISGPELLEIRDMLLEDKYKPWGAASFPSSDNHNGQVIVDKIDDELFTPNSERHSYDEKSHEESKFKLYF